MGNALVVPIHLDALFLSTNQLVVEAMADFSRLPYIDENLKQEINADVANISESIVSQPFQSQNFNLKAGVHLHWALPDALTLGTQTEDETDFPTVPNRWLVIRHSPGNRDTRSWIVESDYIYPIEPEADNYVDYTRSKGARSGSISYYYSPVKGEFSEPFRFVGRQVPLELWLTERNSNNNSTPKLDSLSAVGYGELTFSAFYPNCHSVFGFHDDELIDDIRGYEYEVIGWYSHDQQDKEILTSESLEELKWKISESNGETPPQKIVFYSKLSFALALNSSSDNVADSKSGPEVTISLGTSPVEALSTYLAHQLMNDPDFLDNYTGGDQLLEQLEEQIQLFHYTSELSAYKFDIGSKLREYRHSAGFQAISGGKRWKIRIEGASNVTQQQLSNGNDIGITPKQTSYHTANAANAQTQENFELPAELAEQVNRLNELQATLDRTQQSISVKRWNLFSDWYKYMLSVYQPPDAVRGDDYPDTDRIRYSIREKDIKPLNHLIATSNQLSAQITALEEQTQALLKAYNESLFVLIKPDPEDVATILQSPQKVQMENSVYAKANLSDSVIVQDLSIATDYLSKNNQKIRFPENCLGFNGTTSYVKVSWSQSPAPIKPGFTISTWVKPKIGSDDLTSFYPLFSVGRLSLQLQPRFVISLPMLAVLKDQGLSDQQLTALAKTIEIPKQVSFSTATELISAIPDKQAFASPHDQEHLLNLTARFVLACPGVDDYITTLAAEQWCHIAMTYEAASDYRDTPNLTIFVDGQAFPLVLADHHITGPLDAIFVGALGENGQNSFRGQMHHIRADRRALSAAEIRRDINNGNRPIYQLQTVEASRFWQPVEPVILMTGAGIQDTERHGRDGDLRSDDKLECPVLTTLPQGLDRLFSGKGDLEIADFEKDVQNFSQGVKDCLDASISQAIALKQWQQQPWNPLILEWEVLVQPTQGKLDVNGSAFDADMITGNYQLSDNAVDLAVKPNRNQLSDGAVYSNSCILTSQAGDQMLEKIAEFLQQFLEQLNEQAQETSQPAEAFQNGRGGKQIQPNRIQDLLEFYHPHQQLKLTAEFLERFKLHYEDHTFSDNTSQTSQVKVNDPIYVAICAGLKLFDGDGAPISFLSQSLSGFNDELLMHKQTLQLPVADPLSFGDDQTFTQEVAVALAGDIHSAPEPTNQFSPIRSGAMSITRLRLIDTFGQVKDFNEEDILAAGKEILTPQRLTVPGSPHMIWLPPRLVQPARVDFRWLPASATVSASTPICGWVLPNSLGKSLAIYDHAGKALGSILQRGSTIQWEPAPGRNRQVDEIANPHLRKMVEQILSKGDSTQEKTATDENFLADLLTAIESALATIDPESYAQHRSLALLTGRPLAVVRARLNLELQGEPAVNQGWHAFRADMERTIRETGQFTRVRFPIRIGTHQQLNDGVVGYWKEDRDGYEQHKFYAPQTPNCALNRSIDHPDIVIDDQLWIAKQAFTEKFAEQGDVIWQELLEIRWLKSLGKDAPYLAITALEERSEIPLTMLTPLAEDINELLEIKAIDPLHILQTIDSPPQYLTMLVDPRGSVHVTSGLLPTKTITLPPEDYAPALETIEVSFLTTPILTESGTRSLPLPSEPGFDWTWLEHNRWLNKDIFKESLQAQNQGGQFSDSEAMDTLWGQITGS
jgi:hypothetical protein